MRPPPSLRYSETMFDVLVYLYENYWRPDACPDHDQLTRKLSSVGFESDEIQEALSWLDGVATAAQSYVGEQGASSLRVYSPAEQEHLGEDSIGFISFLESAGVLPPPMREMVLDRASSIPCGPLDLEDMNIIVLMVFWSLG
jgi:Smg protein